MTPTLPSNPSLIQLKKRAKEYLRSHRAGESSCCEMIRHHDRFADLSDADILDAKVSLAEIQHAMARSYGHKNWRTLKDYIDACRYDSATRSDSKLHPAAPHVDLGAKGVVHGLRYDAMQYVQSASGIDGALLRVFSFGTATPQDHDLLSSERKMVLGGQLSDGTWEGDAVRTARQVLYLIELGENPNCTALQKAGHAMLTSHRHLLASKPNEALHPYAVGALSNLGMTDAPELRKALRRLVEQTSEWNRGCPFLNSIHWGCLWPARLFEGVSEAVTTNMQRCADSTTETGTSDLVPWDALRVCGEMDTAGAAELVEKTIPVILRCQKSNGGWDGIDEGDRASFYTLRALKRHGLLEALSSLPSLPTEWRITKSIAAEMESDWGWSRLTWDGGRFWVAADKSQAIAIDPQNGRVLATIALPGSHEEDVALGWWRDSLLVRRWPKTLYLVDTSTGEIKHAWTPDAPEWACAVIPYADRFFITDHYHGCGWVLDPANSQTEQTSQRGVDGYAPTIQDKSVWSYVVQPQYLVRCDQAGERLDWAGNPFAGEVRGVVWDGQNLCALDADQGRICMLERADQG